MNERKLKINIENFKHGVDTSNTTLSTNLSYAKSIENFSFDEGTLKCGLGFLDFIDTLINDNKLNSQNQTQTNTQNISCNNNTSLQNCNQNASLQNCNQNASLQNSQTSGNANLENLKNDLVNIGSIVRVFHFYKYNKDTNCRDDKLIFVSSELNVYYINLYDLERGLCFLRNIHLTSVPSAIRYRLLDEDVILLTSETDNMIVWNGVDEPYEVLDSPKISSMTMHYERLFATVDKEKSTIWFSDDLDPTAWSVSLDEAGYIELLDERGGLEKVVSFGDYIYIFREYGISRLTAYADQTQFSVSNLFVSSGKIYPNSVCVCGDKILFLARDGLYKFDGFDTVKILPNITKNLTDIDNQNAVACYYDGKYYLSCRYRLDTSNEVASSVLLEIDTASTSVTNISSGAEFLYVTAINSDTVSGVLVILKENEKNAFSVKKLCKNASKLLNLQNRVYKSHTTNLGYPSQKKTLCKIYINTKGKVTLALHCDNKTYYYDISGRDYPQEISFIYSLYTFSFDIISTDEKCEISSIGFFFVPPIQ